MFVIGYSSYAIIIIRSASNPPIDQNNVENIYNFVSYLNREQYGDRPLWRGQQFSSKLDKAKPYKKEKQFTIKLMVSTNLFTISQY